MDWCDDSFSGATRPRPRLAGSYLAILLLVVVEACGSPRYEEAAPACAQSEPLLQDDPDATPSGLERCGSGLVHRAQAVQCALGPWVASECSPGGRAECAEHADCADGSQGYCLDGTWPGGDCRCHYACISDDDCDPDQACYCDGGDSRCIPADCRTDADCPAAAYCGLVERRDACGYLRPELACTTPQDQCVVNEDCADDCTECLVSRTEGVRACESRDACGPCG